METKCGTFPGPPLEISIDTRNGRVEARTKGKMRFITFAVEAVAVATVATSMNSKSLQHLPLLGNLACCALVPGAFSVARLLLAAFLS